jgi:hypothetical protein
MTEPLRAPFQPYIFTCGRCRRRGRYKLATLKAGLGPDVALEDLAIAVAHWRGCPFLGSTSAGRRRPQGVGHRHA